MATPSASAKATEGRGPHNAATPQSQPHLPNFTSPAPRSVPSPAAHRQAGKSPFTAATHAHTGSSVTAQNHPTVGSTGSASKALLGSSPAAAMMNFESPLPMSFSLSQLGGGDGGVPMVAGMSGLSGLGLMSLAGGTSDEEKWRRLIEIMDKLKGRPGRVSKENMLAIAQRLGLDPLPEDDGLTLAGRHVIVELQISAQQVVTNVNVDYPESSISLKESASSAAAVLHANLTPTAGQSSITNMLDRFAINLEKLARLDKPRGTTTEDSFNGFEAISGIYSSLRKLYDHERDIAEQLFASADREDEKITAEVLCKKSGRPRMNENGNIGLDLDYWINHRHLNTPAKEHPKEEAFSMSISCEALQPGQLTQAARISDAWVSEQIHKQKDETEEALDTEIDWIDPPTTFVQPRTAESSGATSMETSEGKLPSVRFVAKLRPPLLIPGEAAAAQSELLQSSTFDSLPSYLTSLLLQQGTIDPLNAAQVHARELFAERTTFVGGAQERHANTLRTRTWEQAILLHEIPFDHPKQLIQLLPVLRQFAFLNTMMKASFPNASTSRRRLSKPSFPSNVDIMFSTSPHPQLAITFARGRGQSANQGPASSTNTLDNLDNFFADGQEAEVRPPISVHVSVLPNAQIVVGENNVYGTKGAGKASKDSNERLAHALDIASDLDVWVEFLKAQAAT